MVKGATRMELARLKRRLSSAKRGHKLLKDKSDEMTRRIAAERTRAARLRAEVDAIYPAVFERFERARAAAGEERFLCAVAVSSEPLTVDCGEERVLSVAVPKLCLSGAIAAKFSYPFSELPSCVDEGARLLCELVPRLVELAEAEARLETLERETERTKRRVNALEYVMIPEIEADRRTVR